MSTPAAASTARHTARAIAPLVTLGATWAARKGMVKTYESRTGKPAPLVHSREAGVLEKVLWAAAMSAVLVAIESIVWRLVDQED